MRLKKYIPLFSVAGNAFLLQEIPGQGADLQHYASNVAFSSPLTDLQLFVNGFRQYHAAQCGCHFRIGQFHWPCITHFIWRPPKRQYHRRAAPTYYLTTFTSALESSVGNQWNWSNLRNVNYFLQNYNNPAIDSADKANFSGIVLFLQGLFLLQYAQIVA